ncbi:hypothetical protein Plhal304r1_c014g0053041 [Plasmopara halstedii]
MFQKDEDKSTLAFILNPSSLPSAEVLHSPVHGSSVSLLPTISPINKSDLNDSISTEHDSVLSRSDYSLDKRMEMYAQKSSICTQNECTRTAVSRGCCVRHGGGSRCTYPNCIHGARLYNRCFHHGGCKLCKITGCTSKAKRFGYCWSHGGGRICDEPNCFKVAAPGGLCWAHGGGNRCTVDGCNRRSYQKLNYLCKHHHKPGDGLIIK